MLFLLACSVDDRTLLTFPGHYRAVSSQITTDAGVAVALTGATLTVSSLLLKAPAETVRLFPLIPAAQAHPGHDFTGDVAGELAGTWTLDLLADAELGSVSCYEGELASAQITLLPDPAALLEGTASINGIDLPFSLPLAPDQDITGIPLTATLAAEAPPAGLDLTVNPGHMLSFIDWTDTDGDGAITPADGTVANTALFGLVATPSFLITLEE